MKYGWIVFVVLSFGVVFASVSLVKEPHRFSKEEFLIHEVDGDKDPNGLKPILSSLSEASHTDITRNPVGSDGAVTGNHVSAGSHHPVGVLYVKIAAEKPRKFNPPGALPKEIKLFRGKIGCRTCHHVDPKGKFTLVMSNSGSRLCLGCHIK